MMDCTTMYRAGIKDLPEPNTDISLIHGGFESLSYDVGSDPKNNTAPDENEIKGRQAEDC